MSAYMRKLEDRSSIPVMWSVCVTVLDDDIWERSVSIHIYDMFSICTINDMVTCSRKVKGTVLA